MSQSLAAMARNLESHGNLVHWWANGFLVELLWKYRDPHLTTSEKIDTIKYQTRLFGENKLATGETLWADEGVNWKVIESSSQPCHDTRYFRILFGVGRERG